jgi:hypothetical protein
MALGTQFLSLLTDLRSETRRSSDVSVGVDDNDSLKRSINGVYRTLTLEHEWPHLRVVFPKLATAAGQQYYDYQTGFDAGRVLDSVVWIGGMNSPIKRGIDFDEYSFIDSSAAAEMDPVQSWDVAFNPLTGIPQIEVWPIPASAGFIQFTGYFVPPRLVNDSDPCLLDDELVLLFASARQLAAQGAKDAQTKLQEGQSYLLRLMQGAKGAVKPVQVGLGDARNAGRFHPTIVIKPSQST